jgi:hypothetical protein
MLSWGDIETRAIAFQKRWISTIGEEKQLSNNFQNDFMQVFGVDWHIGLNQHQIYLKDGSIGYIDYFIPGKILIEMKSKGKSLKTAYTQAMTYVEALKPEEKPLLIVCSDFDKIEVHNLEKKYSYKPFKVSQLKNHIRIFGFLAGYNLKNDEIAEVEVNTEASYKIANIHDALKEKGYDGHDLETYIVRIVFCLFAEDTGIFQKESFENYIESTKEDGSDLSIKLMSLFSILDTPFEKRPKGLGDNLNNFRYINGAIFKNALPLASFDNKMRKLLLECSKEFDWSKISPAIFGAMFQGVMDEEKRRNLGAHYTSRDNIMKIINPLFLDNLKVDFEKSKTTKKELLDFQKKLSSLKFLDPACGSGNFLIVAYEELRKLEFEVLKLLFDKKENMFLETVISVKINQFSGIEIEDFPAQVANLSMILMKHLLDREISEYFGFNVIEFPIKESANITRANALEIEWNDVADLNSLNYIFGNPPFIGARETSKKQREEINNIYLDTNEKTTKTSGLNDYVSGWFYKAAKISYEYPIEVGFVATNSITQGEQVESVWKVLFDKFKIKINFAYRNFKWINDAKFKAAVNVVIIGFSSKVKKSKKYLWNENGQRKNVETINAYLLERKDIFVSSRSKPFGNISKMQFGNKPTDGNYLILSVEEKNEILSKNPEAINLIKEYLSSKDYLYNVKRYCIWLFNIPPDRYSKIKPIMERIELVRNHRLESKKSNTQSDASKPSLFQEIRQPKTEYLFLPGVSSENRKYIPMGYLKPEVIAGGGTKIVHGATLYEFGVLTSSIHMVWVKAVTGRLENRLNYSVSLVYNTFPWPEITELNKKKISDTAQNILDVREKYKDSSLAELYNPLLMPVDLLKAHELNDKAVWEAYGKAWDLNSEEDCLTHLFELYEKLVSD